MAERIAGRRILLLNGGGTPPSRTATMIDAVAREVEAAGACPVRWDAVAGRPGGPGAPDEGLRTAVSTATAMVVATPVYHSSFSGVLKSALDRLDAGLVGGKPVGLVSCSGRAMSSGALDQLRVVVRSLHGLAIPDQVIATNAAFAWTGAAYRLVDQELSRKLVRFVTELLWFVERLASSPADGNGHPAGHGGRPAAVGPTDGRGRELGPATTPDSPGGDQIARAIAFMREHFSDAALSLDLVAAAAYMSRFYFSRRFRELTGRRFIDYLTMLRMSEARSLLVETDHSVTSICNAVGYRDLSHFERTFKRWFDVPPSEYRLSYQPRPTVSGRVA